MECPACHQVLLAVEYKAVELDYCPACRGVWLDQGELELLVPGIAAPDENAAGHARMGRRRCPHCRRTMHVRPIPGTFVNVNVCPAGHGVWLEAGELQAITDGSKMNAPSPVAQYFIELFKHPKAKEKQK